MSVAEPEIEVILRWDSDLSLVSRDVFLVVVCFAARVPTYWKQQ